MRGRFSRAVSRSQAPLTSMRTFPERPRAERTASRRPRSDERLSLLPLTLTLAVLAPETRTSSAASSAPTSGTVTLTETVSR